MTSATEEPDEDRRGELASSGQIGVPLDAASWRAAGRRQFEAAYSADDVVYEKLIHDAPAQ
jgi:hypothetical protein